MRNFTFVGSIMFIIGMFAITAFIGYAFAHGPIAGTVSIMFVAMGLLWMLIDHLVYGSTPWMDYDEFEETYLKK